MIKKTILLLLLTCWVSESSAQSGITTVYEYDNLNRLIHVSYQDQEVHYSYDELGNRVCMLVLGSSLTGDVNSDGEVDIDDISVLTDIILGSEGLVSDESADINQDGSVNIADVTALVNIILGRSHQYSKEVRKVVNLLNEESVLGQ